MSWNEKRWSEIIKTEKVREERFLMGYCLVFENVFPYGVNELKKKIINVKKVLRYT